MADEKIIDFTKLARQAASANRCGHAQHEYKKRRNGTEKCVRCGDQFPCSKNCWHVDCWTQRLHLGLVSVYPTEWAVASMTITHKDGTVVYDTTDDDPANWILPTGAETWEDVV